MDENAPATKGDISHLRSEMAEMNSQFRSEMSHIYNDLVERMSDGETRLLKAFYGFAEGNQQRLTAVEDNTGALRSRLASVEDRLLQVEKRLNMPPAA